MAADGANGTTDSKNETKLASGGGAGGSIQFICKNLIGDGQVSMIGGNGSAKGGGGGSGGRLAVNFLRSFLASSYPAQSYYWRGSLTLDGGKGGSFNDSSKHLSAQDGASGTAFHQKCFGGYTGPLCQACPVGTFKLSYSFGTCKPCENKPEMSYYTERGVDKSICPYECATGIDP